MLHVDNINPSKRIGAAPMPRFVLQLFKPISGVSHSSFVLDNHGASLHHHHHDYTVRYGDGRLPSRLMSNDPFYYLAGGVPPN
jgi:hypothetical protein